MEVAVEQQEACRILPAGERLKGGAIIRHPQGLGDTFEFYQGWRVRSWQLLPKYDNRGMQKATRLIMTI